MSNKPFLNQNPYQAPSANFDDETVSYHNEPFYSTKGRIGRVRFISYTMLLSFLLIILLIVLGIVAGLGFEVTANGEDTNAIAIILTVIIGIVYVVGAGYVQFVPSIRRLNDLNRTGWLSLLYFVPFVNLILWIYLACGRGDDGINDYGVPAEPPSTGHKILAFIVPLVLVIGLGILAAIALPAYQNYVIRSKIAQVEQYSQSSEQEITEETTEWFI